MSRYFALLVAVFIQLLVSLVLADDASSLVDYSKARPVFDTDNNGVTTIRGDFKQVYLPGLDTQMFYHGETAVDPKADVILVLFSGTGATTTGYGVANSMKEIADKAIKLKTEQFRLKVSPIGFENPIYGPDKEKYGNMRAQVDWMARVFNFVYSLQGQNKRIIWSYGRSTGAAVLSQLVHEYYIGKPGLDIVGQIDGIIEAGLINHNPQDIEDYDKKELEFLALDKNIGLRDVDVQPYGVKIYRDMTWGPNEGEPSIMSPTVKSLPQILAALSSNDYALTIEEQWRVAQNFSRTNPNVSVVAIGMDTEHNPASYLTYTNRNTGAKVKLNVMKRFSPVLEGWAAYLSQISHRELKSVSSAIATMLNQSRQRYIDMGLTPPGNIVMPYHDKTNSNPVPALRLKALRTMFDGAKFEDCEAFMNEIGEHNIL